MFLKYPENNFHQEFLLFKPVCIRVEIDWLNFCWVTDVDSWDRGECTVELTNEGYVENSYSLIVGALIDSSIGKWS